MSQVHKTPSYGWLRLGFLMWWLCRVVLSGRASPIQHERPVLIKDPPLHDYYENTSKEDNPLNINSVMLDNENTLCQGGHRILGSEQYDEKSSTFLLDCSSYNRPSFLRLMKRRIGAAEKDGNSVTTILIGSGAAVVSLVILTSCCFCIDRRQRPIGVYRMPTVLVANSGDDTEEGEEGIPLSETVARVENGKKAKGVENSLDAKLATFNPTSSDSGYRDDAKKVFLLSHTSQSGYPHP